MAFINKMDVIGANFFGSVDQIRTRLGKNPICLQIPIGKESDFVGLIDLFDMQAYYYEDKEGKNVKIVDPMVTIRSTLKEGNLKAMETLADALVAK